MRDAAGVGEQYVALPDLIGRGRLEDALERRGILGKEIPCMAFQSTGAPIAKLLTAEEWLFIIVTSPESASILLRAWHDAGNPDIPVACVGAETRAILRQGGLFPLDVPIRRQTQPGDGAGGGKELIAALPTIQGDPGVQRILLPVSVKARDDMQRMLEARGFAVHRVDTYDSASVPWNHEQRALAVSAPVVALASPTAIQVYLKKKRSTCGISVLVGNVRRPWTLLMHLTCVSRFGQSGWARRLRWPALAQNPRPRAERWASTICSWAVGEWKAGQKLLSSP